MAKLSLAINTGTDMAPVYSALGNLLTAVQENYNFSSMPAIQGDVSFTCTVNGSDAGQSAFDALGDNGGHFEFASPGKPTMTFPGTVSNLQTVGGIMSGKISIGSPVKFSLGSTATITTINV